MSWGNPGAHNLTLFMYLAWIRDPFWPPPPKRDRRISFLSFCPEVFRGARGPPTPPPKHSPSDPWSPNLGRLAYQKVAEMWPRWSTCDNK